MAGILLLALSLGMLLFRVSSLRHPAIAGKPLRTVTLTFSERLTLQRTNIYGFGIILLLNAIGHWAPVQFVVLAALAAYGILMIPVRYQLTSNGIAINRVVFRPWAEFASYTPSKRRIALEGRPGNGGFTLYLTERRQAEVLPLLQRYLPVTPAPRDAHPAHPRRGVAKGGGDGAAQSKHRLLPRRP